MVSIVPVFAWVAALVATAIEIGCGPRPIARAFDRLLRYLFFFSDRAGDRLGDEPVFSARSGWPISAPGLRA